LKPKVLIVPHAPLRKAGPVVAAAYGTLIPHADSIERVVILGPAHFAGFAGMVLPRFNALATPGGEVPIDDELVELALGCEGVSCDDLPHLEEHSIETQLPFIRKLLPQAAILPVVLARAPSWTVSALLEAIWGGPETLIIISTNLSHHLRYHEAIEKDRSAADAIVTRDATALSPDDACGYYSLEALLHVAEKRLLRGCLLSLQNSTDVTGEETDIVGFGAFVFEEPIPPEEVEPRDGAIPVAQRRTAATSVPERGGRISGALLRADILSGGLKPSA
jgi:AmmeMemoRadiSam system protein B